MRVRVCGLSRKNAPLIIGLKLRCLSPGGILPQRLDAILKNMQMDWHPLANNFKKTKMKRFREDMPRHLDVIFLDEKQQ